MSDTNPNAQMNEDQELKNLLNKWGAPEPTENLDKRVTASYRRQISSEVEASNPMFSQRDSEVVKMKQCPTCQEDFADKFSFCPVDGTPLVATVSKREGAAREVAVPVETTQATIPAMSPAAETVAAESYALAPVDEDSFHQQPIRGLEDR